MVDEIQTGIGRTGTLFAYEQYGIEPDVISIAKGLVQGSRLVQLLQRKRRQKAFDPGSHGSTFGGNPLATAAGVATITHIVESNLLNHVNEISAYLDETVAKIEGKVHFYRRNPRDRSPKRNSC